MERQESGYRKSGKTGLDAGIQDSTEPACNQNGGGGNNMKETEPETAMEALKRWDDGEILYTVEMIGLGPCYELTIQRTVFELIREFKGKLPQERDIDEIMNNAVTKIDKKFDIGHSGATGRCSINLAYHYMKFGYKATLDKFDLKRKIMINNIFNKSAEMSSK